LCGISVIDWILTSQALASVCSLPRAWSGWQAVGGMAVGTRAKPEVRREDNGHRLSPDQMRQVGVVLCTADLMAVGYTYCLKVQRLLDVLNKGLDQGPATSQTSVRVVVGRDFVPLTYAKIRLRTGEQKYMASMHVRKANILFVAEISGGQPDVGGIRDLMRVTKKPVPTEVHVPPYHLLGQMHAEIWEQLADHLEGHDKFLPLTSVSVTPELIGVEAGFDFAAVNKDRVAYIRESNGSAAAFETAGSRKGKKRKPETPAATGCLQCGYPVAQSLRWPTYSSDGALLCRACKAPLS
jgi:hypothetical protein